MKKNYPWLRLSPSFLTLLSACSMFLFLVSFDASAQDYETKPGATDWNDTGSWRCIGSIGQCNANPVPDNDVKNTTITIRHSITYNANPPIKLGNNAVLDISDDAVLTLTSNLNLSAGGSLIVENGQIDIGPGVLNNLGQIDLTNAYLIKNGNIVNESQITLTNSCITLSSGNFNNNGTVSGTGGLKVLSGNINNFASWSSNILYYFANNSSGLPGSPSTEEEVDEFCECVLVNCDIEYAFDFEFKTYDKLSPALKAMAGTYFDVDETTGAQIFEYNPDIYTIDDKGNTDLTDDEVLVEIVVTNLELSTLQSVLENVSTFNKRVTPPNDGDLLSVYDESATRLVLTLYVQISNLLLLDVEPSVNRVIEPSRITNNDHITTQGHLAQGSLAGNRGWDVNGTGIGIAVISDSFGTPNSESPNVTVVQDLPAGGTDEGRAMLEIVHDVAEGADLYFRTGFISENDFAEAVDELAAIEDVDIIVDDLTYLKEPYFKDGVVAQAIERAVNDSDKLYISAAGNFGSRSYEANFSGVQTSSDPNIYRHNFPTANGLQKLEDLDVGFYVIGLQWDDDYYSLGDLNGAQWDLDIYLTDALGNKQFGFNSGNKGADPLELMYFRVLNQTTTYIMIEQEGSNAPRPFKYVVFRAGDDGQFIADPALNASTIVGHNNAASNIAVGAVRWDFTPNWSGIVADIDANSGLPRTFSAQGSSSRGGTLLSGETLARQQPVLMGPTGVDTSVDLGGPSGDDFIVLNKDGETLQPDLDDNPNFFGTSAAAPHVAAGAALIMQGIQKYLTDETGALLDGLDPADYNARKLLVDNAVALFGQSELNGQPEYDTTNGNGFLSVDGTLGSFANPVPGFDRFNYDDLEAAAEPDEYIPGSEPFYLLIEGTDFTSETEVLFRGDPLTPNPDLANPGNLPQDEFLATLDSSDLQSYWVLDDETIALYLDAFLGDPAIIISTPANAITNGDDGGDTDPLSFFDGFTETDVILRPNNVTRLYGQPNPDFSYSLVVEGEGGGLIEVTEENVDTYYPDIPNILELFFDPIYIDNILYTLEDDLGNPIALDDPLVDVDAYDIDIDVGSIVIDPGLDEAFNIDYASGKLFVDPMPVTIQAVFADNVDTFQYGDPIPDIEYVYTYAYPGEDPVPITNAAEAEFEDNHTSNFNMVNGFGVVNSFNAVNGFNLNNGVPEINNFNLVNRSFFVSETTEQAAELSDSESNNFNLVNNFNMVNSDPTNNGDPVKVIPISDLLFTQVYEDELVDNQDIQGLGDFFYYEPVEIDPLQANNFNVVNNLNLVNDEGLINGFSMINALNMVNGWSVVNGDVDINNFNLTNGFIGIVEPNNFNVVNAFNVANNLNIVNGVFSMVNGGFNVVNNFNMINGFNAVNSEPPSGSTVPPTAVEQPLFLLNDVDSYLSTVIGETIRLKAITILTGLNQGQHVIVPPAALFDNQNDKQNYKVYTEVYPYTITAAPLTVTTSDFPTEGEDPVIYGDYGGEIQPEFQFDIVEYAVDQLPNGDAVETVLEGLALFAECTNCPEGKYPVNENGYDILADLSGLTSEAVGNYNITFTDNPGLIGKFIVNPYDLTLKVDDGATITYGDDGPFEFDYTLSTSDTAWTELDLPYGETRAEIFGGLTFNPATGCEIPDPLEASANPAVTPNYTVDYQSGTLVVNPAPLDLQVGDSFINFGDATPSSFDVIVTNVPLPCSIEAPDGSEGFTFEIYQNNALVTDDPLPAGTYDVRISENSTLPSGYENFELGDVIPGLLVVNPEVGCNDRIKLTDICKTDLGDGTVELCFTWENNTEFTFYIPFGERENQFKFKGNNNSIVGGDNPPSLFPPDGGQFCVITNGDDVQWEVITPGCNSASKSANGSNADPCATSAKADITDFDESIVVDEGISGIYPNPVESSIVFPFHGQTTSFSIKVFNEVGMLIRQKDYPVNTYYDVTMDISMLKSGMLYFMIEKNGKREVHRILKR